MPRVSANTHEPTITLKAQAEYECGYGVSAIGTWLARVQPSGPQAEVLHFELCRNDADIKLNAAAPAPVALLRRFSLTGAASSTSRLPPVLLVHGATAWRGTFLEPHGGIVRRLLQDFDVWTLDWRAAKVITDPWLEVSPADVPLPIRNATLDAVTAGELPAAIRVIHQHTGQPPALLGHCIGAAVIATAIARGTVSTQPSGAPAQIAASVVLSTIGLFYRGGVDTWLRAQERLGKSDAWYLGFRDDARPWPIVYDAVFQTWERTPYPHCHVPFCRRISSLFGAPYRPNDIGYIHDANGGLPAQFGAVQTSILDHCARNVRRGWSANATASEQDLGDLARGEHFRPLRLSLLTGGENQLWHRDAIDRMQEWLRRVHAASVQKRVFANFGHQDLWWSPRAAQPGSVYDYVADALR